MQTKFYTVRFQFPLKWKTFLLLLFTLLFFIFFVPDFRKFVYKTIPVKHVAVFLNSERVEKSVTSVMNIFEGPDGAFYFVGKNAVVRQIDGNSETILNSKQIRSINGGKYQSLSCGNFTGDKLFVGDWYGKVFVYENDQWRMVYQFKDKKARVRDIHFHEGRYYAISTKGVAVLSKNLKEEEFLLEGEYCESSTLFKNSLFISTRQDIYKLQGSQLEKLPPIESAKYFNGIASNENALILMSKAGAFYLDEDLKVLERTLPGHYFDAYAKSENFEAFAAWKEGIFIRKAGESWIQFPSPTSSKRRANSFLIKDGVLWASYYVSGFHKIDISRLIELENQE